MRRPSKGTGQIGCSYATNFITYGGSHGSVISNHMGIFIVVFICCLKFSSYTTIHHVECSSLDRSVVYVMNLHQYCGAVDLLPLTFR